jgi:hypothetical protein
MDHLLSVTDARVLRDVPTRHELGDDPEFMRTDRSDIQGVGGRLISISKLVE